MFDGTMVFCLFEGGFSRLAVMPAEKKPSQSVPPRLTTRLPAAK